MHKHKNKYISEPKLESNSISSNDQNREEDEMRLYQDSMTEEKERELEEFVADMHEKQNFIDSINKYSKAYKPIISKSKKSIVILGQNKEDARIIFDFLKNGQIETKSNKYDYWEYVTEEKDDLSNVSPYSLDKPIIYNGSYLNNNNSFSESAFNAVFLQKFLNTLHTKFILTIKDIKIKSDTSPNKATKIKELSNIFKKFASLLENIDIKKGSLSLVVTDVPFQKKQDTVTKIIEEAIIESNLNPKQTEIINELKNSVYTFPKASERPVKYNKLSNILTEEYYITPSNNNKITASTKDADYITNAVKVIKNEVEIIIDELRTPIKTEWENEKTSIFKTIDDKLVSKFFPATNNLLNIMKFIKEYKIESTNKTIENFIKVVKGLKSILPLLEAPHTLENLLNYLNHFSNIKLDTHNSLEPIDASSWFNNLFSKFTKVNVETELLVAFKGMLRKDENSFFNILKKNIETLYQDIKNNKILDGKESLKIEKLKDFVQYINESTAHIKNFDDINYAITDNLRNFPYVSHYVTLNLKEIINNLKTLISLDEQGVKSLWQDIIKFIPKEDINKLIYNKLLNSEIMPNQDAFTYTLLEGLLITTHESMNFRDQQTKLYNFQLAEIYCRHAEIGQGDNTIELYKKAAELGSTKADINLGQIYLQHKNDYAKGLEYLRKTPCISDVEQAFRKLISEKETKPHNNNELVQEYLSQAEFYLKNDLIEHAKKAYLDATGKFEEILEPKYYSKLSDIYYKLAEIASSPRNKSKFFTQYEEYKYLASKSNYTHTDLNSSPTPVKKEKVEPSNAMSPLIPYDDLASNNSSDPYDLDITNLQMLGNNMDSGYLGGYKSIF